MNLKQFSTLIGLSPTTVSRALGDYPEVSQSTKDRVRAAAQMHNYQPNERARRLALGRSKTVGFVMSRSPGYEFFSPIFGDFIAGATTCYADAGYDTIISLVDGDDNERAFRSLKASGKVDGIIVQAPTRDDQRIDILRKLEIPFVVHGRASTDHSYPFVDVNNLRAFKTATELLLDLGHTRIALLNGNEKMDFALRRREGFESALISRGLTAQRELMSSNDMTELYGYQHMAKLLCSETPPTAALVSSLLIATGVRRAIEERGMKLGIDFSLITHDDDLSYLPNGGEAPIYTATRSNVRNAGVLCAQILLKQIEDGIDPSVHHIFESELIIGASTGRNKHD